MITLHYSTTINAPKEKVWQYLWEDASYRKWTAAFMEGSYAESNWNEGDKIYFLTPKKEGMFGIIQTKIPNAEMTFRHLGEIKDGVEEPKNWQNATESYRLSSENGHTQVDVILTMDDANKEFENYFSEAFPKALAVLKDICES